jgi:hypothetical protein
MAIIFEMWVECGTEVDCARMAAHFDGFKTKLLTGRPTIWNVEQQTWCPTAAVVSSSELSRSGVRSLQDALEATESGLRLYHHLQHGPSFRFARAAWEAQNVPIADLRDYTEDCMPGERLLRVECAMDDALYRDIGSPINCYPFRDGYRWTRYSGETYKPLYSSDATSLNDCCRSLFPEYFKFDKPK